MKALLKSIIFVITFTFSTSCKYGDKYNDCSYFSFKDFQKDILLKSCNINFDEPIMLPGVLAVKDSVLFVQNKKTENLLYLYNLNSLAKIKECIPFGMGPNEFLRIKNIQIKDSCIYISDNQKGNITRYRVNDIICKEDPIPIDKTTIEMPFNTIIKENDLYVATTMNPHNKRLCFFNEKGDFIKTKGEFPTLKKQLSPIENMESFLSEMTFNTNNNRLFVFCMQTDLLEIYTQDGELIKRLHGPEHFYPHIKEVQTQGGYSKISSAKGEARDAYFTPISVEDKIYVSYSGTIRTPGKISPIKNILVFDSNGNPLIRYRLPEPILRFTVCPKTKTIYAISDQPEYHIIKLTEE